LLAAFSKTPIQDRSKLSVLMTRSNIPRESYLKIASAFFQGSMTSLTTKILLNPRRSSNSDIYLDKQHLLGLVNNIREILSLLQF
jgi:hypothetical protein